MYGNSAASELQSQTLKFEKLGVCAVKKQYIGRLSALSKLRAGVS